MAASAQIISGPRPRTTAPPEFGFLTAFRTVLDITNLNGIEADRRFNWDADVSIDVDVVDAGFLRGNLFASVETIIGNQLRGVDPNQNNYTADMSVFFRLPRGELMTTFHHVSRHMSDRSGDQSISWNMIGVGYGNLFTLSRFNVDVDAGVRALWTVERAGVDYVSQFGAYFELTKPISDRFALIGSADGVAVKLDPEKLQRGNLRALQLEGGLRIINRAAAFDLYIAREQRIDATSQLREFTQWTKLGVRIVAPFP